MRSYLYVVVNVFGVVVFEKLFYFQNINRKTFDLPITLIPVVITVN